MARELSRPSANGIPKRRADCPTGDGAFTPVPLDCREMSHLDENEAFQEWRLLRATSKDALGLITLYELAASANGRKANELNREERERLQALALPVMYPGFQEIPASERPDHDPIFLVPYDAAWPIRFVEIRDKLLARLKLTPVRVDHVGSTAVPGLPAKPVIDMLVCVPDPDEEAAYVPAIESLGVQLRSRDDQHRFFRPFAGLPRDLHVHVCQAGSDWERRHILFRDYLRAERAARELYAADKHTNAVRWADDRIAYAEAKTACIDELLARADAWARSTGWSID